MIYSLESKQVEMGELSFFAIQLIVNLEGTDVLDDSVVALGLVFSIDVFVS